MSLTREQYEEIYRLASNIDRLADYFWFRDRTKAIKLKDNAKSIKKLVEDVIGQQE